MAPDLARLGLHDDRRLPGLRDPQEDHRPERLAAPVPVLTAVDVAVTGRLRQDRERRTALVRVIRERVMRRELAARIEREHILELNARALGDAADLVTDAGEVILDRRDPARRIAADLRPVEPGDPFYGLLVVGDRFADLLAGGLTVLAS